MRPIVAALAATVTSSNDIIFIRWNASCDFVADGDGDARMVRFPQPQSTPVSLFLVFRRSSSLCFAARDCESCGRCDKRHGSTVVTT
jgi:hypothetical protein